MGIWRDMKLGASNGVQLEDVYMTQVHTGEDVTLQLDLDIKLGGEAQGLCQVVLTDPEGKAFKLTVGVHEGRETLTTTIEKAKKWWPHGYGEANLYRVDITLKAGQEVDTKQ